MKVYAQLREGWLQVHDIATDSESLLRLHGCEHTALHSKHVAEEAAQLANRFGIDPICASMAGYLHDISAIIPNHQRIQIAEELRIEILPEERTFPMIIHQKISKAIARDLFSIQDAAVLGAIECHTTLKSQPSRMDLVLFVADKIAWDQAGTPPYLHQLQSALDKSIEHAAFVYLSYMWEQREKLRVMHPWLVEAYRDLRQKNLHLEEGGKTGE
ncbi:bis(5'-nucleosyl)-tetraphosphatase (symmetrical) YqeK [uncultured Brevibacillus sp.]|uniref:bis(5'-nucleosyl)-tetraphosphatase (symmetrical) YqeK n=1 Tax=uncultured Brevibacillus sp. TaxID=169970 RepID=UPI00259813AE|nr:bis(5'-nucleosyl)-tetraphosphatase (symmetrical) YqeK [uncultured Brevibacillus sp.]